MSIDPCESRLNVHLSCTNLRNMDFIGRSDPFALLFLDDTGATAPRRRHLPPPATAASAAAAPASGAAPPFDSVDDARRRSSAATSAVSAAPAAGQPTLSAALGLRSAHAGAAVAASAATPLGYTERDARWQRIGTTETIANTLNPTFATSFEIPYFFERSQRIAVDVFDRDAAPPPDGAPDRLARHDYLGSAEIPVPHIVRAPGRRLAVPLAVPCRPAARCGSLVVVVEELSATRQCLRYDATVTRVPRSRLGTRRPDAPCLTVLRRVAAAAAPSSTPTTASRSVTTTTTTTTTTAAAATARGAVSSSMSLVSRRRKQKQQQQQQQQQQQLQQKQQQTPTWIIVLRTAPARQDPSANRFIISDFVASYEQLCRRDDSVPLRFELSYQRHGKHRVFAAAEQSLSAIEAAHGRLELHALKRHADGSGGRGGGGGGGGSAAGKADAVVMLQNRTIWKDPSFLDYIIGGCEISLIIGIDFTASNGDPAKRGTRHFVDQMQSNEYELAIREVGDILAAYDTDQMIPAYGFGARLPPDFEETAHIFALNQLEDAHCYTVDEVLNVYRQSLYTVRLSGPTHFAPLIRRATEHCRREADGHDQSYSILLIITDGVISDLDETLAELNRASSLPFSVVIIGVGDEDFSDMDNLDGDFKNLERDIVQFVEFRRYQNSPEVLRSRVLEEIPRQFLQYMQARGMEPRDPPTAG